MGETETPSGKLFLNRPLALKRFVWTIVPMLCGLLVSVAGFMLERHDVKTIGGCPPASSSYLKGGDRLQVGAITYCTKGDGDRMSLSSDWFPAGTRRIDIQTAGYGVEQGQTLSLETTQGQRIAISMPGSGEQWLGQTIIVPSKMSRYPIRLVEADNSEQFRSWSGLSIVSYSSMRIDLQVIAQLIWILTLLQFSIVELSLMFSRRMPRDEAVIAALLALGLASFVTFGACYGLGKAGAFTGMLLDLLLLAHLFRSMREREDSLAERYHYFNKVFVPLPSSVLVLCLLSLYPFPQDWDTWQYAADRWQSLPMDIWLPKFFADQLWAGHVTHPMIGDWLSSDRPPLQTGFYLMLKPLAASSGALYLLPAMWLQATCIVPMYYVLRSFKDRINPAPIVMLITISPLFLYNGSFVWPKLIAGTFCAITYLALFSTQDWLVGRIGKGIVAGLGSALAMLSHGGAAFALFGIFAIYLFDSHSDKWRIIGVAAITAFVAYLPWMLYQKLGDPPGTRLLAWQLAGVQEVSIHGVGWIFRHAYAQLTPAQWLQGRIANLAMIFDRSMTGFFRDFLGLFGGHSDKARLNILVDSFSRTFYSQWFFAPSVALGLLTIAWRRIGPVRAMLVKQLAVLAAGLAFWSLVMFTPGSTIIHQGAYFLDLLGLVVVGVLTFAASTRLFYVLLGLNVFIMLDVFVRADRVTNSALPPLPINLQSQFWIPSADHTYIAMVIAAVAMNFLVIWQSYCRKEHATCSAQGSLPQPA